MTRRRAVPDRFWPKVERTATCWLWTASLTPDGYGQFGIDNRSRLAHRVSWELANGPVPADLTLDHLCRVRHCVRPDHMEPVTRGENVLRGEGISARNARKSVCLRGHPFTHILRRGDRVCETCNLERNRIRLARVAA